MPQNIKLILASNSPRRRELLALGGWDFQVYPADVDETVLPGEDPREYVVRIAQDKVNKIARQLDNDQAYIILGADTTVVDTLPGGQPEILGKPVDEADARRMLVQLHGRTHEVLTGITALRTADNRMVTELAVTHVPMRNYSDEEIDAYIATGDPMDKAGAYAIQHEGFHPVEKLDGCYTNVVGLPICLAILILTRLGLPPQRELTTILEEAGEANCPEFQKILKEI